MMQKQSLCAAVSILIVALASAPSGSTEQTSTASFPKIERSIPPIPPSRYQIPYEQDTSGILTVDTQFDGQPHRYHVYPADAAEAKTPRPLIFLLHGAKRTGASMIDMWRDVADAHDVVLVAPDSPLQGWELSTDTLQFFDQVLDESRKLYSVDPKRTYLFGHSAGGVFSIYTGLFGSQVFCAVSLHAGKFSDADNDRIISNAKRKIPFAFFIGTRDDLFPISDVEASARMLSMAGHEVLLVKLLGHTHWYYDLASFINTRAWQFFQKCALP